jgi:hypothetical protein
MEPEVFGLLGRRSVMVRRRDGIRLDLGDGFRMVLLEGRAVVWDGRSGSGVIMGNRTRSLYISLAN